MEQRDYSKQLTDLHHLSLELAKSDTFHELCRSAVESAHLIFGPARLSFWFIDKDNSNFLKGAFGTDENGCVRDEREIRIPIKGKDSNDKLLSGEIDIDYRKNTELFNEKGEVIGYGEIAVVALWDGAQFIGSMSYDNLLTGNPITVKQRDLLLVYGRTIGNLSSLKLAGEELQSHSKFEKILNEITHTSIEQLDLKMKLETLENLIGKLFNCDKTKIFISNESFSELFSYEKWELELFDNYRNLDKKLQLSEIPNYASILLLPLLCLEEHKGLILVAYEKEHSFTSNMLSKGEQVEWQIALAIQKAELFEKTKRLSTIDELTGMNNRRNFFLLAENEIQRSIRNKTSISLLMIDIDHFKKINDSFGHTAGDSVLTKIGATLLSEMREIDILGRYGGEEFIAFLPDTDLKDAETVGFRLLNSVRAVQEPADISISIGISNRSICEDPDELSIIIEEADSALYRAKHNGRNRFEFFSD